MPVMQQVGFNDALQRQLAHDDATVADAFAVTDFLMQAKGLMP